MHGDVDVPSWGSPKQGYHRRSFRHLVRKRNPANRLTPQLWRGVINSTHWCTLAKGATRVWTPSFCMKEVEWLCRTLRNGVVKWYWKICSQMSSRVSGPFGESWSLIEWYECSEAVESERERTGSEWQVALTASVETESRDGEEERIVREKYFAWDWALVCCKSNS